MKIKQILATFVLLFIGIMIYPTIAYAEGETDSTIQSDFFNKTFGVEISSGDKFIDDGAKRLEYNKNIVLGKETKELSLYDRFGSNVTFVPYYGEKKFNITLMDTIYQNMKENNREFTLSLDDILEERSAEVNNVVYDKRPDILTNEDLDNGKTDPRVSMWSPVQNSGGTASLGNFYLLLGNWGTLLVGVLVSNRLPLALLDLWEKITTNDTYKGFTDLVEPLIPVFMIAFVIGLIWTVTRVARGKTSIREVVIKTVNVFVSLGMIYFLIINPTILNTVNRSYIETTNKIFSVTLNQDQTDVAESDDDSYTMEAALWSKAVLDPWSKGMFGYDYAHMNTQYADVDDDKKFPQSHDNTNEDAEWEEGELKYDSAKYTGNIKVPLGGDKVAQNWAALALSTQSTYHIDAVQKENADKPEEPINFPIATTTPNNNAIYIDNFRWIDAKLNIAPGIDAEGNEHFDYKDSREYKVSFVSSGFLSIYRFLLMLPIAFAAVRSLFSLIKIVISAFRYIWMSISTINQPIHPDHSLWSNFKKLLFPFYEYMWWQLSVLMLVTIYNLMVGNTILAEILWLILAYVIYKFRPWSPPDAMVRGFRTFKSKASNLMMKARARFGRMRRT